MQDDQDDKDNRDGVGEVGTPLGSGARLSAVPRPRNQGVHHAQAYSERERERVMDGEKHGVIISRLVEMSQHAEGVPQGGILR